MVASRENRSGCYSLPSSNGASTADAGGASLASGGEHVRTAEATLDQWTVEQREAYVQWLASGGAERLREKLEANASKRLSSSCAPLHTARAKLPSSDIDHCLRLPPRLISFGATWHVLTPPPLVPRGMLSSPNLT